MNTPEVTYTHLTYNSLVDHIDRIGKGQGGETNTAEVLIAVKDILDNGR